MTQRCYKHECDSRDALVRRSIRERSGSKAHTAVGDVEHVVEALQKGHAVDEVQTLSTEGPKVVGDEVYEIGSATDSRVQL